MECSMGHLLGHLASWSPPRKCLWHPLIPITQTCLQFPKYLWESNGHLRDEFLLPFQKHCFREWSVPLSYLGVGWRCPGFKCWAACALWLGEEQVEGVSSWLTYLTPLMSLLPIHHLALPCFSIRLCLQVWGQGPPHRPWVNSFPYKFCLWEIFDISIHLYDFLFRSFAFPLQGDFSPFYSFTGTSRRRIFRCPKDAGCRAFEPNPAHHCVFSDPESGPLWCGQLERGHLKQSHQGLKSAILY